MNRVVSAGDLGRQNLSAGILEWIEKSRDAGVGCWEGERGDERKLKPSEISSR